MTTTDLFAVIARRTSRACALALVPAVALATLPAHADVPEGWDAPTDVDGLHALLLLGGVPLTLFVTITVLTIIPALIKGERVLPDHSSAEAEWIGGPRQGTKELPTSADENAGGASGNW